MPSRAIGPWFTEKRARRLGWLVITLAVLVVYWPLSTFQYTTDGGDTFDCWLAWRHFITLALNNGELPLWNPLQQMGYPVYADLQGPFWYPEAIALGGTVGHSIWTLQALFLFYVIIGGIGFMRLCISVHGDARIGLVTGLAYSLCGFLAAHQMHFYSIISAAWMPWFLSAQLRLMRTPHWRIALEAAVTMMLLLTGGNHTFTIIAAYLLLPLFILHAGRAWVRGERHVVGRLVAHQLVFMVLTLVFACGTFYAWIEVSPYLGRMHGLSYDLSSEGPANPTTLPTLLFPGLFGKNDWTLGTYPAMANSYMGVLMLALALIALLRRRTALENVFAVFGLCCLLISFANDLPFHRFAWRWLPGLNVFRFPSYYLYFTLLAVLVLAAGSLKDGTAWRWGRQRSLIIGFGFLLLVGTALVLLLPERFPTGAQEAFQRSLFERARALSYTARMMMGWAITAPVLMAALLLVWRKKLTAPAMLALVFLEMGWNTHLSIWNSSLSDLHPSALHARLAQVPNGPVIPDLLPVASHHDSGEALHFLWQNTQTFLGTPSREGFNSFWPSHTDSLINHYPALVKAMDRQAMVYLTDQVLHKREMGRDLADSSTVFVTGKVPHGLHRSADDKITFTDFSYGGFTLRTRTQAPTFLLVQQTWFPGWAVRIDDEPAEVIHANVAAFGSVLPGGEHVVEVRFEKPLAPWLMAISMTAFVVALLVLSSSLSGPARAIALSGTAVLGGMIAWSLLAHGGRHPATARVGAAKPPAANELDVVVYSAPGPIPYRLYHGHEFTPAFTTAQRDLLSNGQRSLIVDLDYQALGRCTGLLVFQRTFHGKPSGYEAVRFVVSDTVSKTRSTWSAVRDLRELRFPDDELAIYVWNQGPDTLVVTDMRIRTTPREVWNE